MRFHGEVISADASAGVAFAIYKEGETTAYTLASAEHLLVTDIDLGTEVALTLSLVADTDAAGRRLWKGYLGALDGLARAFKTPHLCPKGVVPKLIASGAGNVVGIIHGEIVK